MINFVKNNLASTLKYYQLILFIVLVFFYCHTVYGQEMFRVGEKNSIPRQYKYGFYVKNVEGVVQTTTKDVIDFIHNTKQNTMIYTTTNNKIASFYPIEDSTNTNLPQCVQGTFKVVNIEVKKGNYYVKDNHLRKTKLYLYDVEQEKSTESTPKYVRILVFQHEIGVQSKKMKLAQYYNLTLDPFLRKDCCKPNFIVSDGDTIFQLRHSSGLFTYIINGVLVPYFNFSDYNIMEIKEIITTDKIKRNTMGR